MYTVTIAKMLAVQLQLVRSAPDYLLQDEWTPLMLASQNGHIEVVLVLLEHGAVVNAHAKVTQFPKLYLYLHLIIPCIWLVVMRTCTCMCNNLHVIFPTNLCILILGIILFMFSMFIVVRVLPRNVFVMR